VIAGIGNERYLIGQVFGLQPGALSKPIKGESAVFQIVVGEYSKVEEPKDLSEIKSQLFSNYEGMAQYETMEALTKVSEIEDNRYMFY